MNEFEAVCREWLKACSCAPKGEPWQCEECTRAFHDRICALVDEEGRFDDGRT